MKHLYKRVSPGEKILHVPKACGIAYLCNVVSVAMRLHSQILSQLVDVLASFCFRLADVLAPIELIDHGET